MRIESVSLSQGAPFFMRLERRFPEYFNAPIAAPG